MGQLIFFDIELVRRGVSVPVNFFTLLIFRVGCSELPENRVSVGRTVATTAATVRKMLRDANATPGWHYERTISHLGWSEKDV